ncbi:type II toxin-antitoxin system PemK/MazF family toxin [Candidatus Magnetaquicoccus inordinatus]|uniref:type II toxin-antitoxin system PemK/MazF family toxin n=1 Tax=Candidatus Magnetaquicoccus inordinatus TaxID=2496818 RepID=UPI001D0E2B1A|nr:type II toxin-antitoxin system PemK/MazF family toxin [Candidatus Magnetaquicoccus inordinatus]
MVPFPFSNLDATKKRPVLVLIKPDERGDFIGLAVTSVPTDNHSIEIGTGSVFDGSLPKRSWLRLDKIFTLNVSRVEGMFARVSVPFRSQALQRLCLILAQDVTFAPEMGHGLSG